MYDTYINFFHRTGNSKNSNQMIRKQQTCINGNLVFYLLDEIFVGKILFQSAFLLSLLHPYVNNP